MAGSFHSTSWARHCPEYDALDVAGRRVTFLSRYERQHVARADDLEYVVEQNVRLDQLAMTFYRSPALWWVIADRNDIALPGKPVAVGSVLWIPNPGRIGRT